MSDCRTIRVVRDGEGALLMKWVEAAVAQLCDECGDGIRPFQQMAVRSVPFLNCGRIAHTRRCFCKECGDLLEDSLVTTEAE